ncbi:Uncharacterised protein [uncultured archaeon]|nr:Uncharacterised protein [uncultured archaeon]
MVLAIQELKQKVEKELIRRAKNSEPDAVVRNEERRPDGVTNKVIYQWPHGLLLSKFNIVLASLRDGPKQDDRVTILMKNSKTGQLVGLYDGSNNFPNRLDSMPFNFCMRYPSLSDNDAKALDTIIEQASHSTKLSNVDDPKAKWVCIGEDAMCNDIVVPYFPREYQVEVERAVTLARELRGK